jgi:cell fate regulator YaaT (PSP1 superfamily)
MKYEFHVLEETELLKNKVIKRILDTVDLCDLEDTQKKVLRSTILDEINELYRKMTIG